MAESVGSLSLTLPDIDSQQNAPPGDNKISLYRPYAPYYSTL